MQFSKYLKIKKLHSDSELLPVKEPPGGAVFNQVDNRKISDYSVENSNRPNLHE